MIEYGSLRVVVMMSIGVLAFVASHSILFYPVPSRCTQCLGLPLAPTVLVAVVLALVLPL